MWNLPGKARHQANIMFPRNECFLRHPQNLECCNIMRPPL